MEDIWPAFPEGPTSPEGPASPDGSDAGPSGFVAQLHRIPPERAGRARSPDIERMILRTLRRHPDYIGRRPKSPVDWDEDELYKGCGLSVHTPWVLEKAITELPLMTEWYRARRTVRETPTRDWTRMVLGRQMRSLVTPAIRLSPTAGSAGDLKGLSFLESFDPPLRWGSVTFTEPCMALAADMLAFLPVPRQVIRTALPRMAECLRTWQIARPRDARLPAMLCMIEIVVEGCYHGPPETLSVLRTTYFTSGRFLQALCEIMFLVLTKAPGRGASRRLLMGRGLWTTRGLGEQFFYYDMTAEERRAWAPWVEIMPARYGGSSHDFYGLALTAVARRLDETLPQPRVTNPRALPARRVTHTGRAIRPRLPAAHYWTAPYGNFASRRSRATRYSRQDKKEEANLSAGPPIREGSP